LQKKPHKASGARDKNPRSTPNTSSDKAVVRTTGLNIKQGSRVEVKYCDPPAWFEGVVLKLEQEGDKTMAQILFEDEEIEWFATDGSGCPIRLAKDADDGMDRGIQDKLLRMLELATAELSPNNSAQATTVKKRRRIQSESDSDD